MIVISLGLLLALTFHLISFWLRSKSVGLSIDKFFFYSLGVHSLLLVSCFVAVTTITSVLGENQLLFIYSFFFSYFIFLLVGSYEIIKLSNRSYEKAL